MNERELFEEKMIGKVLSIHYSESEGGYIPHDLMRNDESTKALVNIFNMSFYMWCASVNREGYKLVPVDALETMVTYGTQYAIEYDIDELHKAVELTK